MPESRPNRACRTSGAQTACGPRIGSLIFRSSAPASKVGLSTGGRKSPLGPRCARRVRTPGHFAFVELHKRGKLDALITQNIERLHQRSGLPAQKVLELHGTTTEAVCLSCGDRITSDEACRRVEAGERAPRCRLCSGFLKPATISFGQSMPLDVMARAHAVTRELRTVPSGRFVSGGRTCSVNPAPREACRSAPCDRKPGRDPARPDR